MKAMYSSSGTGTSSGTKKKGAKAAAGLNPMLMMAVALIVAGFSFAAVSLFGKSDVGGPTPIVGDVSAILASGAGAATGYADGIIASAQQNIKANANDYKSYARLGLAFQQKARETNDPNYYIQAEDALKKALAIKPDYYEATAAMGTLNLSRHEFSTALDWGLKARNLAPNTAYAYGVIGDAQIELGEYDAAVQTFQKMVDTRPDLSSYSRVSYARELYGDVPGAIQAMQQAVTAGGPAAENTAWCRVQLGNLYFNSNQLDKAEYEYNEALAYYPNYLHAQAGLAQVRWAQGRNDEAIQLYKQAIATVPLPLYVTALGDLLTVTGDKAGAKEQLDLALYTYKIFEAAGVNVNIEKAMYLVDHSSDPTMAVKLAEEAAKTRQDIHTQDTLAWAYYQAGRYQDALATEKKAMRLNTQSAILYFHLGMIYNKLGDDANSQTNLKKALAINPYFSILYSQQAASLVKR